MTPDPITQLAAKHARQASERIWKDVMGAPETQAHNVADAETAKTASAFFQFFFKEEITKICAEAIAAALREQREQLVSGEDWDALLLEISKLYALIDDEWEDADISNMGEFDPWEALRKIKPRITAKCAVTDDPITEMLTSSAGAATAEPTSVAPLTRCLCGVYGNDVDSCPAHRAGGPREGEK